MASKTYTHEFVFDDGIYSDVSGISWKIVIEDTDTSSTGGVDETLLTVRKEGFIKQSPKVDAYEFTPIGSEVTIPLVVTSAVEEELVAALAEGQEGRFMVTIYKDTIIWWAGVILNDLSSSQSISKPYTYNITATDYISALKDLEYRLDESSLYSGEDTILGHLLNILGNLPTASYWDDTTAYIRTVCAWTEDNVSSGNIYENTRFSHDAFINTNKYGVKEAITKYEVLLQLCKRFNARLYMHEGRWLFEQISEKENISYLNYYYTKTGTYLTQGSPDMSFSGHSKVDRQLQFTPPLLRVKQEYLYKEGTNNGNLLDASYDIGQSQNLGTIPVDGAFSFTGEMRTTVIAASGSGGGLGQVRLRITLRVGTYYFTNESGTEEWLSDGSVHYYEVWNPAFGARPCPDGKTTVFSISVSFFTPPIPVTDTGVFISVTTDYIDEVTPVPTTFSFVSEWINPILLLTNAEGTLTDGEKLYQATNTTDGTTPVKSSQVYETEEQLLIGDGPNPYSVGRLEIYTGTEWQAADIWHVMGVAGMDDISLISVRERLALQLGVRKRLIGYTLIGYADIGGVFVYDGENYACDGGQYIAGINQFNGDFSIIKPVRTNIKLEEPLIAEGTQSGGGTSGGGTSGTSGISVGELQSILSSIIQQGVVTLNAGNSYTADISFSATLVNTNYSYPEWGRSGNNVIPVSVTNISTTGFTVIALQQKETIYKWFAILK